MSVISASSTVLSNAYSVQAVINPPADTPPAPQGPPTIDPPPTKEELDGLAAAVAGADDDAALALVNNPRAMALLTPEQKAALIRALMDGSTGDDEEAAIRTLLLSCKTLEEMQKVVALSGGIEAIADEVEEGDIQAIAAHGNALAQQQQGAAVASIDTLEKAKTPEEFMQLYQNLGGDQIKLRLPHPAPAELLARLDALGQRFGVANVGFGMPAERVNALQAQIDKAIQSGDCEAIAKLSENPEAMRVATPAQKAQMIRALQEGWTKDSQDMAVVRILLSCGDKKTFDDVVDMAGGREIIEDIDLPEARIAIDKLMGGFDRLDCADNQTIATAYRGMNLPPNVDRLTRTRSPSESERGAILGGPDDPRANGARAHASEAAYDLNEDPAARNQLAMENRERELNGQPPLDYTSLTAEAYRIANDPGFEAEVQSRIAAEERDGDKLDESERQEIREDVLAERMGPVAAKYGLTEQEMKTLVTAKMGHVLREGAQEVAATAKQAIGELQVRLAEVERTKGPSSREARELRDEIERTGRTMGEWAKRLDQTGAAASALFKVPPSFAEDFVSALSVISDALAVAVNLIPGVGSAISATYFGVKAIVGFATGDVLGGFKSMLSAIPGVSGAFGAAGAAISAGAKVAQAGISAGESIAAGNPLGFLSAAGGVAGNLGLDFSRFAPPDSLMGGMLQHGAAVGGIAIGVARGDVGSILGGLLPGELRSLGAGELADQLDELGSSPAGEMLRDAAGQVGNVVVAIAGGDPDALADALKHWLPGLASNAFSSALGDIADQAGAILGSPVFDGVVPAARSAAREAREAIEEMAALGGRADDVRQLEDALASWLTAGGDDGRRAAMELLAGLRR